MARKHNGLDVDWTKPPGYIVDELIDEERQKEEEVPAILWALIDIIFALTIPVLILIGTALRAWSRNG
jgi:hypothetical protein